MATRSLARELPIAWVIAAEAAAARGRPTEARRHAERLRSVDSTAIDAIFAGAPVLGVAAGSADARARRRDLLPAGSRGRPERQAGEVPSPASNASHGSLAAAETQATGSAGLWDSAARRGGDPTNRRSTSRRRSTPNSPPWPRPSPRRMRSPRRAGPGAPAHLGAHGGGRRGRRGGRSGPRQQGRSDPDADPDLDPDAALDGPDPVDGLDAGRAALAAGDPAAAAVHLGLVLRLAPALAPRVLDMRRRRRRPRIGVRPR